MMEDMAMTDPEPTPTPTAGEVEEVLKWLHDEAASLRKFRGAAMPNLGWPEDAAALDLAASLLTRLSAERAAVVEECAWVAERTRPIGHDYPAQPWEIAAAIRALAPTDRLGAVKEHLRRTLATPGTPSTEEAAAIDKVLTAAPAAPPTAEPCKWVGGNDYSACITCGLEYDYRSQLRPPCPRAAPPVFLGAGGTTWVDSPAAPPAPLLVPDPSEATLRKEYDASHAHRLTSAAPPAGGEDARVEEVVSWLEAMVKLSSNPRYRVMAERAVALLRVPAPTGAAPAPPAPRGEREAVLAELWELVNVPPAWNNVPLVPISLLRRAAALLRVPTGAAPDGVDERTAVKLMAGAKHSQASDGGHSFVGTLAAQAAWYALRDAGITLTRAGAAPEGWMLVPKEPTDHMKGRGHEAMEAVLGHNVHSPITPQIYAAMLAAAPLPNKGRT